MQSESGDLKKFVDRLVDHSSLTVEEQFAILALPTERLTMPSKGRLTFADGQDLHTCYVVSGLIAEFRQARDGVRQTIAYYLPGDMVNLHSAFGLAVNEGLQAESETIVLRIRHCSILELIERYPAIAMALWRSCMLDAAIVMQWIRAPGRKRARNRVAHLFCELGVRYGKKGEGALHYLLPLTQEQLSEAVSLTPVHLNRVLRDLREKKIVSFKAGHVSTSDWTSLARMGEFDSSYLIPASTRGGTM